MDGTRSSRSSYTRCALMSGNFAHTKNTLLALGVEIFFAVLPLLVLGAATPLRPSASPHKADNEVLKTDRDSFWTGPEVPMTSCILYGLTLARLLQGAASAANRERNSRSLDTLRSGAGYAALSLFPILGLISSVLLIAYSVHSPSSRLGMVQWVNVFAGMLSFILLGGHGIRIVEAGAETL